MSNLDVWIIAGADRPALQRTLENVRENLPERVQIGVLATQPLEAAEIGEARLETAEGLSDMAALWLQGLGENRLLVLEAGEVLSKDAWQAVAQAQSAALLTVQRADLREHAPRLLTPGTRISGRVHPTDDTGALQLLPGAEIDARVPGLEIHAPEARVAWLEALTGQGHQDPDLLYELGWQRFQQRRDAEALELFARLAARPEGDFWTLSSRVMELKTRWELQQREQVLELLDTYRQRQPNIEGIPGLWVLRGVLARHLQEADLAMDCFQQALDLGKREDFAGRNRLAPLPDISWKPQLGLAETQLREGMFSQAFANFRQVLEALPGNDYVITELLKASFFIRRYDTLSDLLAQDTPLRGLSPVVRRMLGQMLALQRGETPDGLEALISQLEAEDDVKNSDPFLVSVQLEFSIALLHRALYPEARTLLRQLARLLPEQPVIWHNLAYSHFAEGQYAQAEQFYRQALSLDARFHDSRFDLAKVLVMQQRRDEALHELYELKKLQPLNQRVQQAIRQLEPAELDAFVPPMMPEANQPDQAEPSAEEMPFIFVFPLAPDWENGADIALKAYYQEFVPEDRVILAFACESENALLASAREWAEQRFAPEQLPPVVLMQQSLPLLPGRSAWVLPWRLHPGEALEKMQHSGYPAIHTRMQLATGSAAQPMPAKVMAEELPQDQAPEGRRRLWLEADAEAIANQMRLALYGDFSASQGEQISEIQTHDLLDLGGRAEAGLLSHDPSGEAAAAPGISVCMIVRDEEQMLAKCLESVHDQVDEIIVVDTGSVDKTREIAASFAKVRLFEQEWNGDFSQARNFALAQASQPWILALDADEYVGPEFVASLEPMLAGPDQPDAYAFPVLAINNDGEIDQQLSLPCVPRLFPNAEEYRYKGRIHEMVYHAGRSRMRYFFMKQLPIFHTGYRPEVLEAKQKRLRDTALLERMIQESPAARETQRQYVILAHMQEENGENAKALQTYEQGLGIVTDDPLIQAMLLRGKLRLLLELGRDQEVLEASEAVPEDAQVAMLRAQALRRLGRRQEALLAALLALHQTERHALQPDPLEQRLPRENLLRDLAQLHEESGDPQTALYYFKRYLKLDPSEENQRIYQKLEKKVGGG